MKLMYKVLSEEPCRVSESRGELKATTQMSVFAIESRLQALGFVRLHPTRKVYSRYWDTFNFQDYHDHKQGIYTRQKLRQRWYEDGHPAHWEQKVRTGIRSTKIRFLNQTELPPELAKLKTNRPRSLDTQFVRSYWTDQAGQRVTVDRRMQVLAPRRKRWIQTAGAALIVECKTINLHKADPLFRKLNLSPTAHSKYNAALETLWDL